MELIKYLESFNAPENWITWAAESKKLQECTEQLNHMTQHSEAPLKYIVPKVSADGLCSLVDEPHEKPFDLEWLIAASNQDKEDFQHRNNQLQSYLDWLYEKTQLYWLGFYSKVSAEQLPRSLEEYGYNSQTDSLVKLCYVGSFSRALFPLSKEFAQNSNNSDAIVNQTIIHVPDVMSALAEGRPYYECDAKVKSEVCLPLIHQGEVIGLLDVEADQTDFFNQEVVLPLLAIWQKISEEGLIYKK